MSDPATPDPRGEALRSMLRARADRMPATAGHDVLAAARAAFQVPRGGTWTGFAVLPVLTGRGAGGSSGWIVAALVAALVIAVAGIRPFGSSSTSVGPTVPSSAPVSSGGGSGSLLTSSSAPHTSAGANVGAVPHPSRGPILPMGPDPRSGQPFATAAQASAAGGGFYVPECTGHTDYFLQPNGAVVTLFQGNDSQLWVYPPGGPFISGPIQGNSVVTPQKLVVQGQPAYGYEATPKIVQLTPTHAEGVLVHSYLTWGNHGSSLELSSAADLSLSQLEELANSCT
jgi:hypothetical protein